MAGLDRAQIDELIAGLEALKMTMPEAEEPSEPMLEASIGKEESYEDNEGDTDDEEFENFAKTLRMKK